MALKIFTNILKFYMLLVVNMNIKDKSDKKLINFKIHYFM